MPPDFERYKQKLLNQKKSKFYRPLSPSWFLNLPKALGMWFMHSIYRKTCPYTVGYFYFKWTSLSMISAYICCYARLSLLYRTCYAIDCIDDRLFCKNMTSYIYIMLYKAQIHAFINDVQIRKTKRNSHDNKCCQKNICSRNFCFCFPHFLLLKGFSAWKDHKIVWSRFFLEKLHSGQGRGKGRIPQVLIYVETGMRWTLMLLLLYIRLNEWKKRIQQK